MMGFGRASPVIRQRKSPNSSLPEAVRRTSRSDAAEIVRVQGRGSRSPTTILVSPISNAISACNWVPSTSSVSVRILGGGDGVAALPGVNVTAGVAVGCAGGAAEVAVGVAGNDVKVGVGDAVGVAIVGD